MSTLKVNNISNVSGTKEETTDVLVDKKFGDWTTTGYVVNTVYQATTDLFVVGYFALGAGSAPQGNWHFYTDSSNPPTTEIIGTAGDEGNGSTFCFPVKKGDYFKFTASSLSSYTIKTLSFGS